jgi:hypothetical protein
MIHSPELSLTRIAFFAKAAVTAAVPANTLLLRSEELGTCLHL